MRLAYHDGVYIYENTRALPRAYAAFSAISAESGDSALDAVAAAGFDPRAQVVLEDRDVPAGAAGLPLQTAQGVVLPRDGSGNHCRYADGGLPSAARRVCAGLAGAG